MDCYEYCSGLLSDKQTTRKKKNRTVVKSLPRNIALDFLYYSSVFVSRPEFFGTVPNSDAVSRDPNGSVAAFDLFFAFELT